MRPLRNFKTDQCCHLISRIANRAFFLNDEEKTRFVERLWRVATFSCVEVLANFFTARYLTPLVKIGYMSMENPASIHSPLQRYRLLAKGRRMVRLIYSTTSAPPLGPSGTLCCTPAE